MSNDEFDVPGAPQPTPDVQSAGNGTPQNILTQPMPMGVPSTDARPSLEQTVGEERLIDQRARIKAELEERRRQLTKELKSIEEEEKSYLGRETSMADLWDQGMKNIIDVFDDNKKMGKLRKGLYEFLGYFGVDMYSRNALGRVKGTEKLAAEFKGQLDYIDNELNKTGRRKGTAVLLREERSIAKTIANALAKSKKMEEDYTIEIEKKQSEFLDLQKEAKEKPDKDFTDDLDFITGEIEDLKKERTGLQDDIRKNQYKLQKYDTLIEAKDAVVSTMAYVHDMGKETYYNLMGVIDFTKAFIEQGGLMKNGIGPVAKKMQKVVKYTGKLQSIGNDLVGIVVEGTKQIRQEMETLRKQTEDNTNYDDLSKLKNQDEQRVVSRADKLIAKHATVAYK